MRLGIAKHIRCLAASLLMVCSTTVSAATPASDPSVEIRAVTNLRDLNRRWSTPEYPATKVSEADLVAAEDQLAYRFPTPYRQAVLEVGLPSLTADIWDDIDAANADLAHLSDFLSPGEALETTRDWASMGLPKNMVAFAADSSGNLFAFRKGSSGDAVWFFDHDFGTTKRISSSFADWLASYCKLPNRKA